MRNFLALAALMVILSNFAYSQKSYSRESENFLMGVGPYIGYKIGVNAADPQDGLKNGIGTAGMPDFGASFYLPLNPDDKMGVFFDIIYGNSAFTQKFYNSSDDWTDRFNFLDLGTNFYISGFTVGLNIGIPLSGERVFPNETKEIQTSSMNTKFEFKVGGSFTLTESDLGRLLLSLNGSYQINGLYTDEMNLGSYNPHPASIQLGLSYLFNMQ